MTAGKGLIHAEVSSDEFKSKGGPLEILQLWVNLPSQFKVTEPKYVGLQKDKIPEIGFDDNKIILHAVSGTWFNERGAFQPITDIALCWIDFKKDGKVAFSIEEKKNIFFYVIKGEVSVNDKDARMHHLVQFEHDGDEISIKANVDSTLLFGHATPFNEPFAAQGPFVMNTKEDQASVH